MWDTILLRTCLLRNRIEQTQKIGLTITSRFGQISMTESTGLAKLFAELVGRFGQAFSADLALILGRTVRGTVPI